MPEGIQRASAEILYEFNDFFGAFFGSCSHGLAAAHDTVVFFYYTGEVL
jgi:hypothetical protein